MENTIKQDVEYYIQTAKTFQTIEEKISETCEKLNEYFRRKAEKDDAKN